MKYTGKRAHFTCFRLDLCSIVLSTAYIDNLNLKIYAEGTYLDRQIHNFIVMEKIALLIQ